MSDADTLTPIDRIILPLDGMNEVEAFRMVDAMLDLGITQFKVGKSLINRGAGGSVAKYATNSGGHVFWDNKDGDIANTMVDAAVAANELDVAMFNVFAHVGLKKLEQVSQVEGSALALAVTVLTDMDDSDCLEVYGKPAKDAVLMLAAWAETAQLDGIICSAADLDYLREAGLCQHMRKVCPGIRPPWAAPNDQKRITTPAQAIKAGADYLVIGRPITKPPAEIGSSAEAVKLIVEEIAGALAAFLTEEA